MSGQGGWTSSHRMTACGPGTGLKIVLERHATHALLEGSSACAGCVIAPGSVNHGREPRGRDSMWSQMWRGRGGDQESWR